MCHYITANRFFHITHCHHRTFHLTHHLISYYHCYIKLHRNKIILHQQSSINFLKIFLNDFILPTTPLYPSNPFYREQLRYLLSVMHIYLNSSSYRLRSIISFIHLHYRLLQMKHSPKPHPHLIQIF